MWRAVDRDGQGRGRSVRGTSWGSAVAGGNELLWMIFWYKGLTWNNHVWCCMYVQPVRNCNHPRQFTGPRLHVVRRCPATCQLLWLGVLRQRPKWWEPHWLRWLRMFWVICGLPMAWPIRSHGPRSFAAWPAWPEASACYMTSQSTP